MKKRHPSWIRVKAPVGEGYFRTKDLLRKLGLHTICQEALCPNIGECLQEGRVTFLILGNICTRDCKFCGVRHGTPTPPDPEESLKIANGVSALGLGYVVITSVTRDDLEDGGASQFVDTVEGIKNRNPLCRVETLIPDLMGKRSPLEQLLEAPIDILSHNLETVPGLYARVRQRADYKRSLRILSMAKEIKPTMVTKSGLMLGLGEKYNDVIETMVALRRVDCNILTLGQYLQPSKGQFPVVRYLHPSEFADYKEKAQRMGFQSVQAGPLVRSSYRAEESLCISLPSPNPTN